MCKNCSCQHWDKTALLELVINSFSQGIVVLNSEGKVAFCNRVAEDILGYSLEELMGEDLHSFFIKNEKLLLKVKNEFELLAATGRGCKFQRPQEFKLKVNGIEKKIQLILKAKKFQGEWIAIGIFTDVTKQRELEREILIAEKKFQVLFEFAPDAIFLLNKDGLFIDANVSCLKLFGLRTKKELIGKTPYELSPEFQPNGMPSKELALEKIQAAFSGKVQRFEWVHKNFDNGRVMFCEVNLSKVDLSNDSYVFAIVRDITNKKILEQELKKKNKLILQLSETAPVGIIRFNGKGEIEYKNHKAQEILTYMGGGSLDRDSIKSMLKKYNLLSLIEKCSKEGATFNKELTIKNKNEQKWLNIIIDPIELKKNSPVRMILRDITSEKMVELAKEAEQRKNKILLESLPHPAWLINKDRKIIAQNKAAEKMGSKVGDYCWKSLLNSKYIPPDAKETMQNRGIILPGIKCSFCMGDDVLITQKPKEIEMEIGNKTYDVFWIPVNKNLYLHYLIDITKYKELQNKLMDLSMKDPLTHLYNRRYFIRKFEEEVERCKRFSKNFCIIMLDIDDFKKINDSYGHNVGDEVLINVAITITKRIRKTDIAARWGGEEFIILLPETNLRAALLVAEDIRSSIEKIKIQNIEKITASLGVAEYRDGDNLYNLINRVDKQLYKAKMKGKNQVCCEKKKKQVKQTNGY